MIKSQLVIVENEQLPLLAKWACVELCLNLPVNFDHDYEF